MNLIIAIVEGREFWVFMERVFMIAVPAGCVLLYLKLKKKSPPPFSTRPMSAVRPGELIRKPTPKPSPPPPGSRLYQFARKGTVVGTHPEASVADLIAGGQIEMSDDYWSEGMSDWQKVSNNPAWR